ncbi:MAG: hypothetical protein KGQ77_11025 [Betaproteobacteria bacterium]|nr:hypothetical protein [Betaproteobacteria bacterium]
MFLSSPRYAGSACIPACNMAGAARAASAATFSINRNLHRARHELPPGAQSAAPMRHAPAMPSKGDDVNPPGGELPARAALTFAQTFHRQQP